MTKFYLIRHGETEWNDKRILMGQTDIPINDKGHTQAKALGEYAKKFAFDYLYSSDLCRAKVTADYIANSTGMEIITDKNLRECSAGKLEGLTYENMKMHFPDQIKQYSEDPMLYLPPEGEARKDFINRVKGYLIGLSETNISKNIAIVTHGGVIRAFLSYLLALEFKMPAPEFAHLFRVDNCSVTMLQHREKWEITYVNDTHHLKQLL